MGQTHKFDAAEYTTVTPAAGVPMLDWPSDLFGDNASLADLMTMDYPLQCDPAFLPHAHHSEGLCIQLAA
jgi:hypothetical protein